METTSYLLGKKAGGGGGITPTGTINITQNGTTDVTTYASANVNVQPNLETKNITITENDTTVITPTSGKDGISSITITTNVSPTIDWDNMDEYDPSTIPSYLSYKGVMKALQIRSYEPESSESWSAMWQEDTDLIYFPELIGNLETTNFQGAFFGCSSLVYFPQLDLSNATNVNDMFHGCYNLSKQSIDNIVASLINVGRGVAYQDRNINGVIEFYYYYNETGLITQEQWADLQDAGWYDN